MMEEIREGELILNILIQYVEIQKSTRSVTKEIARLNITFMAVVENTSFIAHYAKFERNVKDSKILLSGKVWIWNNCINMIHEEGWELLPYIEK